MCGDGPGGVHGMTGPMWMPIEPPTLGRLLAFHPQPIPLVPLLALLGLLLYLWGVWALHKRGDAWPFWRTLLWAVGIVLVIGVTATGVEGYGMMLFSVHMAQHMVLSMIAPLFLLMGSPFTLALRALPARGRGSGVRRFVVMLMASRFFHVMASIPMRWFLFLSGLYVIYFTPAFDWLMHTVAGHNWMLIHFIITGLLFFGPLVRADPWPTSPNPAYRLIETFISTPFHAFFGIAIMVSTTPVVNFFTDPPLWWKVDLLADQDLAGGIAWATAEIPTVLLGLALLGQWFASDQREAKRHDRQASRDDDEQLRSYNEWLAQVSRADGVQPVVAGAAPSSEAAPTDGPSPAPPVQ